MKDFESCIITRDHFNFINYHTKEVAIAVAVVLLYFVVLATFYLK